MNFELFITLENELFSIERIIFINLKIRMNEKYCKNKVE